MNGLMDFRQNDEIVKSAKIVHLCASALFLLCGIFVLALDFTNDTILLLVGIVNIVSGGAGIFGYFSNDSYRLAFQSDFALGIISVVVGILLCVNPWQVISVLPFAVSILAVMDGGNKCQIAVEGCYFGLSKWFFVLIFGVLEIAAGVLGMIFAYRATQILLCVGIPMILVGGTNFFTTMYMVRVKGNGKGEGKK